MGHQDASQVPEPPEEVEDPRRHGAPGDAQAEATQPAADLERTLVPATGARAPEAGAGPVAEEIAEATASERAEDPPKRADP